ncbi:MAG: CBS domain-containing protein [Thermoanaerobaculia bacterium]|nr:CBS domain-containing protein [Thermoanaerobaculia bacterium]
MRCPFCGEKNIPGADLCDACGADLAGLDIPESQDDFEGALMTDRVEGLSMGPALVVERDDSVAEAVKRMRRYRHGCALVTDGEELVGIFTERDLLTRVIGKGSDPAEVRLGDVMTSDPFTLTPEDPPAFAIHRMVEQGLRHLPVVEDDELVGFISVRNILRYIHEDVIAE